MGPTAWSLRLGTLGCSSWAHRGSLLTVSHGTSKAQLARSVSAQTCVPLLSPSVLHLQTADTLL